MQITFDDKDLESHRATSAEIKECCRDIKVLGRKELRYIFTMKPQWWTDYNLDNLQSYISLSHLQSAAELEVQVEKIPCQKDEGWG